MRSAWRALRGCLLLGSLSDPLRKVEHVEHLGELGSKRGNVVLAAVGVPLVLILVVMARVVWWVGSQPARESVALVAQADLFVATFQATLALCLTLVTLYYAMLTRQMVAAAEMSVRQSERSLVRDEVERLTESAIGALASAGVMARLMENDWRWYIPGRSQARGNLLLQQFPLLTAEVKQVAQSAEALKVIAPELAGDADDLTDSVLQAFDAANEGKSSGLLDLAQRARETSERLRDAVRVPGPARPINPNQKRDMK